MAFTHDGPAVVDVVTSKCELAMPSKIEIAHAKGFSLFMLRAILGGRGGEIIEPARTNLRRGCDACRVNIRRGGKSIRGSAAAKSAEKFVRIADGSPWTRSPTREPDE